MDEGGFSAAWKAYTDTLKDRLTREEIEELEQFTLRCSLYLMRLGKSNGRQN